MTRPETQQDGNHGAGRQRGETLQGGRGAPDGPGTRGAGRALRPAAGSCTRDVAAAPPSASGPSTAAWERPAQAEGEGRAGGRRTRWRRLMAASPPARRRRRRPAPERASAPGSPRLTWPGARGSGTRVQRLPGADGGGAGADGGGWRRARLLPSPSLTPRLGSD